MNRIALITCYMGPLPSYFRYFLDSAKLNPDIDFYIFNSHASAPDTSSNVKIIPLTLEQFNALASEKLELPINIKDAYKLCDFKPAYGVIFEDYLKSYEFWGDCDLDVIWGKISHFMTDEILQDYDVINARTAYLVGHFVLYRNSGVARDLFRQTDSYKQIFTDPDDNYYGFDETCHRWDGKFYSLEEVKQLALLASITDITLDLQAKQQIRLYQENLVREYPDPFLFTYRNGIFLDHVNDSKEFMYFHLVHLKKNWRFLLPPMPELPNEFTVLPGGLMPGPIGHPLAVLDWKIKKSASVMKHKLQRLGQVLRGWD
jgi:hypothetical protein